MSEGVLTECTDRIFVRVSPFGKFLERFVSASISSPIGREGTASLVLGTRVKEGTPRAAIERGGYITVKVGQGWVRLGLG